MSETGSGRLAGRRVGLGKQIARVLHGAWRVPPPPLEWSAARFDPLVPRLVEKGEAALIWRRLGLSAAAAQGEAMELLQASRLCRLQAALHARNIEETVGRLRAAGVEPILFKGWAVARLYPESGLRPYCDIDCLVPPERYDEAGAALRRQPGEKVAGVDEQDTEAHSQPIECGAHASDYVVDLHHRLPDLADRSLDEINDRSRLMPLGETKVRVLGPEDQLRLSALHFLRHGGWRPLWLCDVALMMESAATDFDWDYCLHGPVREREWLMGSLHLAHQLLGAGLERLPAAQQSFGLPDWMVRAVHKAWGRSYWDPNSRPMASYLRNPRGLLEALTLRWADPIGVTLRWRLPLSGMPRLPWQVGDYLARTARMVGSLAVRLGQRRRWV